MNDQDIIKLYFERNERAIVETDRSYGKVCMQVSMNILDSRPDAEECVSDTYLKTWKSIPPARPNSLCAFVCRIARNISLNRHRDLHRDKRNRELTVSFEELEDCIPVDESVADQLPELLTEFLRGMNETDRKLFVGRYWHSLSVGELAETWGLTPNAVALRLHKTRERLRAHLEKGGYTV
jgi:RNA polymerase sigma-70 factor (ECF subfamily)